MRVDSSKRRNDVRKGGIARQFMKKCGRLKDCAGDWYLVVGECTAWHHQKVDRSVEMWSEDVAWGCYV